MKIIFSFLLILMTYSNLTACDENTDPLPLKNKRKIVGVSLYIKESKLVTVLSGGFTSCPHTSIAVKNALNKHLEIDGFSLAPYNMVGFNMNIFENPTDEEVQALFESIKNMLMKSSANK